MPALHGPLPKLFQVSTHHVCMLPLASVTTGVTEQVDALRQVVGSILDGQAEQELRALVAAWRSSDAPAMREYLHRVANSPDPVERAQFARLITARNAGMAEKIDRLLQDGRFYLIAVGALHCFGDDGLVEVLRARGYAVTPVDPGRGP